MRLVERMRLPDVVLLRPNLYEDLKQRGGVITLSYPNGIRIIIKKDINESTDENELRENNISYNERRVIFMTNLEFIKGLSLEELADFLDSCGFDGHTSEEDDTCSCCEYNDELYGCMNDCKWTNHVCDPFGVRDNITAIKQWLMEERAC